MLAETSLKTDKTRAAVITIILTVFALSLGDAIIKGVSASFTLWQIFLLRSVCVVPVLLFLLKARRSPIAVYPGCLHWTILRSMLLTLMWITYYAALPHINLSVAAASYYTLPLFISLFAAGFLGDSIGRLGWLAIVLGFIGVLLVLQPQAEDFNWYAILPISSAVLYALAMILTRSRCQSENVIVLSLWLNLCMLFVGAVVSVVLIAGRLYLPVGQSQGQGQNFLLGSWSEMGALEYLAIGILSIAIIVGSTGAAYAYQNGKPATIATFDFAYVAFAVLWGLVLFNEVPNFMGAFGMALIVIAGILAVSSN